MPLIRMGIQKPISHGWGILLAIGGLSWMWLRVGLYSRLMAVMALLSDVLQGASSAQSQYRISRGSSDREPQERIPCLRNRCWRKQFWDFREFFLMLESSGKMIARRRMRLGKKESERIHFSSVRVVKHRTGFSSSSSSSSCYPFIY